MIETFLSITAIVTFLLIAASVPLYFVYSGPPPRKNVLQRSFIELFYLAGLLIWAAGIATLVNTTYPEYQLLGNICAVVLASHALLTYVAIALQAGSVLGRKERFDPTLTGTGIEAFIILTGPVSRVLEAVFLVSAGIFILATGIVAPWTAWLSFVLAVANIALTLTLFSTTQPEKPFSINGWHIPIIGGLFTAWIVAFSVQLIF